MAPRDDLGQPAAGPGVRLPGLRGNPDGSMPLMEHIRELRNRIFKALLFVTAGAIAGWFLYPHIWHFIETPYCRLDLHSQVAVSGSAGRGCHLYVTGIFDAFFLQLKISIIAGAILSSPFWLYQLWAFLAPGLYARERRWAYFFAGSAVPLFVIGGTLAYFAMTKGLHFLLALVPGNVVPIITINTYLSYALAMLTIFGIAFELPLALALLNVAGVLTHQRFAKWRRMIIFSVFLFAAVATPSPDPLSMLLLAVPCVALVEMAEVFAFVNDRRRARALAANPFPGLSPAEVAAYGLADGVGLDASDQAD
ncbi:MAG: twin-arginine translocase subunit TatC [Streptosporangiaceae bacterium]